MDQVIGGSKVIVEIGIVLLSVATLVGLVCVLVVYLLSQIFEEISLDVIEGWIIGCMICGLFGLALILSQA